MDSEETNRVEEVALKAPYLPIWAGRLFKSYNASGRVKTACKSAGITPAWHRQQLKINPAYRSAFQEVHEGMGQILEDAVLERAIYGVKKQLFFQGEPMMLDGKYVYESMYDSHREHIMLKRFKPDAYRDRASLEVTGHIEIDGLLSEARARLIKLPFPGQTDDCTGTEG